jgi:CBS domain-containing protein
VLWEYRSRGVLTTGLVAIVALDDALAMTLYGLGTSAAGMLMGSADSLAEAAGKIGIELIGAIALGLAAGFSLNFVLRRLHQPDKTLALAIGSILLVIATALIFSMDVILATMTMGVVLTNIAPRRSKGLFEIVRSFSAPIYVIFFVFVGARLGLSNMPVWMCGIVGLYVLFRTVGKMAGTYFGARITGAAASVRKYGGLGLFAQGGVAVGLSIMASQHLGAHQITKDLSLGDMIIFCVTATTLIVQVIGPPMVKLAIRLAGESGMNITREDLIAGYKVGDIMNTQATCLAQGDPFAHIMKVISETDAMTYPVVDDDRILLGIITIQQLKSGLGNQGLADMLVAYDLMQPVADQVTADTPLGDAIERMRQQDLEYLPVVEPAKTDGEAPRLLGLLELRRAERSISKELLRRQEAAIDREQADRIRDNLRRRKKQAKKA